MEQQSKTVMFDTLVNQTACQKTHALILDVDPNGIDPSYTGWLTNMIDTADVTVDINDYTDQETKDVDYIGFYTAQYDQLKAIIKLHLSYEFDNWVVGEQIIVIN